MKKILATAIIFIGISISVKGQGNLPITDTIKVILDNHKVRVTEYSSTPGKDICGKGKHSHIPHLSILLTDAKVTVTTEDGKSSEVDVKAGTTFWSEAETHIVINSGRFPAKAYIVELKQDMNKR